MSYKGILRDEAILKMCAIHQSVPLNRLDLLLPVPEQNNGVYTAPLGQPNLYSSITNNQQFYIFS